MERSEDFWCRVANRDVLPEFGILEVLSKPLIGGTSAPFKEMVRLLEDHGQLAMI